MSELKEAITYFEQLLHRFEDAPNETYWGKEHNATTRKMIHVALDAMRRAQPENEPIVRCGECKIGGGSDVGGDWVFCKNNQLHHKKDHYCSYGERKPERSEW